MGYTHYYQFKKGQAVDMAKFADAVALFNKCLTEMPKDIIIRNGIGEGEPIINNQHIVFNGDADNDLDYETFAIEPNDEWNCCKTGQQPYDLAVCLCLLSFKEVFADDFDYHSDGTRREDIVNPTDYMKKYSAESGYTYKVEEEWERAYEIFDKVVGKSIEYPKEYTYWG